MKEKWGPFLQCITAPPVLRMLPAPHHPTTRSYLFCCLLLPPAVRARFNKPPQFLANPRPKPSLQSSRWKQRVMRTSRPMNSSTTSWPSASPC